MLLPVRCLRFLLVRVFACSVIVLILLYLQSPRYKVEHIPRILGRGFFAIGQNGQDEQTTSPTNASMVLIMTYLRSGSTLTADIISQVPGMFYTYEPLKHLVGRERTYIKTGAVCDYNGTCSVDVNPNQYWKQAVDALVDFYNCKLDKLPAKFLWNAVNSQAVAELKKCIKENSKYECYRKSTTRCMTSPRSVKTIRLSMEVVANLMSKLPNLKVIHLVRDPRGSFSSRASGGFIKQWRQLNVTQLYSEALCNRLKDDLEIADDIQLQYPGRFSTLHYENIATSPEKESVKLFQFLTLQPNSTFKEWLFNHTFAGIQNGYYETSRANSSRTASSWRQKLPFENVQVIDSQCSSAYSLMDLLPVESEEYLQDMNKSLRIGP